jgi:hypothetical protein
LQFFIDRRPHLVDLICVVFLQLLQPKIDSGPHIFERLAQFFPLILCGRACFLTVAREFVA